MNRKLKFFGFLTIFLFIAFLVISYISYTIAKNSISDQIKNSALPLTSDNIYSEIQRDLFRPIFISSIMSHDTFVRDWVLAGEKNQQEIIRYLKEIQDKYHTISSFYISEKTRKYYHAQGILKTISENDPLDQWYFRVRALKNQDYEINIDQDTADRRRVTIFINYRIYDYDKNFLGVIGVGLSVKAVKNLIEKYQQKYQRTIYFINRHGKVTLRGSEYAGEEDLHNNDLSQYLPKILNKQQSRLVCHCNGKKLYLNSRYIKEFDWYLIVEQAAGKEEQRIFYGFVGTIGISLLLAVLVGVMIYYIIGIYQRRLEKMASTDSLTGLLNRQFFSLLFNQAASQVKRAENTLSIIMFDIDHFKQVNDQYGHLAGDTILKSLARTVKYNIREADIFFRWGGEEFLIILPMCNKEKALHIAEKIRKAVEKEIITHGGHAIKVTISLGVAEMNSKFSSEKLISQADKALYQAKKQGRNRVESSSQSTQAP